MKALVLAAALAVTALPLFAADSALTVRGPVQAKAAEREFLRLAPAAAPAVQLHLAAPEKHAIQFIREANSRSLEKRLQIGVHRSVEGEAGAHGDALVWTAAAGGMAAHWEVVSAEARALRIGLRAGDLPRGLELRFSGSADPATVYGPFTAEDIRAMGETFWSPVLQGDRARVEVFVPGARGFHAVAITLTTVSHFFANPAAADLEVQAKVAGACEVDLICRSATEPQLAEVGKSVARMTYSDGAGSYTCTGTLLATTQGAGLPYFYSASHCINTQSAASTLTTHWFFDAPGCGSGGVSPSYVQRTGGATLLYNNATTDVLLLRLNSSPPAGAVYAGWNAAALGNGTALTAVHHPSSDVKKVSLGTMGGFASNSGGAGTAYIIALWNGTATGVTEGGSSGSGIFTASGTGSTYQLRGGLYGGPSSCSATGTALRDYYSRFDQAYPSLSQYLNPTTSCSYSIAPANASYSHLGNTGSFTVTTTAGCGWSAISNAGFVTTSSVGTGSGTVNYAVAGNTGAARSGTITVGGQTFTVNQSSGAFSSRELLANGDFESGPVAWVQSSTGGYPIINLEAAPHAGSYNAWLGGYISGVDTLHQDFTVPSDATAVTLTYWRQISTQEVGPTPYDTFTVTLRSPTTGAVLTTLAAYSNANANPGTWIADSRSGIEAFKGQTVRLHFTAANDFSNISSFRIDDVSLVATLPNASSNADVAIGQATPNPAGTGKDAIVTLTATNNGPASASGVYVTYPVPAGASFVWASPNCLLLGGTVTCTHATLAAAASASSKVVVRPAVAGTMNSNASVTATTADPMSANNTSALAVTVAASPAGVPILRYRLYSDVTKEHHFTTDLNEYTVLGGLVGTWVQEGTVGKVLNNPGSFGGVQAVPYYRLYDNNTRWHHWTTDANEYYTLGYVFSGWNMEGVDGYILPTQAPGTVQLYRLNYPALGALHHWTIDQNEYTTLIAQFGWVGEPGAGFVIP